jgi:nitrogen fixation protein NifB
MPICPVEGTPFENVVSPSCARLERLRAEAGVYIRQMMHCTRCRADAVGLLGEDDTETIETVLADAAAQPIRPQEHRPYVAVASQEGVLVNRHLGEADRLLIFDRSGDGFEFVEARPTPPAGGGDRRWRDLADTLSDCRAVLAAGAGDRPTTVLAAEGLKVLLAEGLVEELLGCVYEGRPVRSPVRRQGCQSGAGCSGDGSGCG